MHLLHPKSAAGDVSLTAALNMQVNLSQVYQAETQVANFHSPRTVLKMSFNHLLGDVIVTVDTSASFVYVQKAGLGLSA